MTTNHIVLTGDEIRAAVREARNMSGPSDATHPGEYVIAGAQAILAKLREADPVARDWKAIQDAIDEYLDGYELRLDEGCHTPTEFERFLIDDAIGGLLTEDDLIALLGAPPQASAEAVPLSQYGYQDLFNAIGKSVKVRAHDSMEISVQAFRDALKSTPAEGGGQHPKTARDVDELFEVFAADRQQQSKGDK